MNRPDRTDGALVAGSTAVATALTVLRGDGVAEGLFGTVCLAALALLGRALVQAWGLAADAQRVAARLAAAEPSEVALQAVREERQRLSLDITRVLREDLGRMEALANGAGRPDERARAVHAVAQQATAELRRQLGLLTEEHTAEPPVASGDRTRLGRHLAVTVAVVLLAVTEAVAYPLLDGSSPGAIPVLLTAATAAAVVGRSLAPAAGAAAAGVLHLLAALLDTPLQGGFWFLAGPCALMWATVARGSGARAAAGVATLVGGVVVAGLRTDPDNLGIGLVALVVAAVGGAVGRRTSARAERAREAAAARAYELAETTGAALAAERSGFARDLHDQVSHAVGLIGMQAAAAQVSWPADPAAARAALDVVARTARTSLADLDRSSDTARRQPRRTSDVVDLVDRVRAAGTSVTLVCPDHLPVERSDVVYRVVQEGLTNVVRHAHGASARVTVSEDADGWHVRVEDDGPGAGDRGLRGFGLTGLVERVRRAGGFLTYGDVAGGFAVDARLPRVREEVGG